MRSSIPPVLIGWQLIEYFSRTMSGQGGNGRRARPGCMCVCGGGGGGGLQRGAKCQETRLKAPLPSASAGQVPRPHCCLWLSVNLTKISQLTTPAHHTYHAFNPH
jgi:hypothetical protein